jgi:hypothetical protein
VARERFNRLKLERFNAQGSCEVGLARFDFGGTAGVLGRSGNARTLQSPKVGTFFALQRLEIFENRANAKLE